MAVATDPLVDAIFEQRLAAAAREIADDPDASDAERQRARAALATCTTIGDRVHAERDRLLGLLDHDGIAVRPVGNTAVQQHHTITFEVAGPDIAEAAAGRLLSEGYEPWERWAGGARESFRRFATQSTVARTADATTVVRLRWARRPRFAHLGPVLTPTAGDWSLVTVPSWMWPVYSLVRPIRLVLERTGLRSRHRSSLAPFLSTPESLVLPLLEFAGVGRDDVLVDVGCGDGRFAVAAAGLGARAIGIERSAHLVARARRRVAASGLGDRIEVYQADALTADLGAASVVVMFLSVEVVGDLVGPVLARLTPGARLVVHEQSRLPRTLRPAPDESRPIISDDAVTVAHRWTVPSVSAPASAISPRREDAQ